MAVKRRIDKKRVQLSDGARAWLRGEPCGFFPFKSHDILIPLWEEHGDFDVATWDMRKHSRPVTIE
jgi:hypothetical protein